MKEKERSILNFLKKNGKSSTTKIAYNINSNVWKAEEYLTTLYNQGKVICETEENATYWSEKND